MFKVHISQYINTFMCRSSCNKETFTNIAMPSKIPLTTKPLPSQYSSSTRGATRHSRVSKESIKHHKTLRSKSFSLVHNFFPLLFLSVFLSTSLSSSRSLTLFLFVTSFRESLNKGVVSTHSRTPPADVLARPLPSSLEGVLSRSAWSGRAGYSTPPARSRGPAHSSRPLVAPRGSCGRHRRTLVARRLFL